MSARLPAIVISSTGYAITPFSTQNPAAPLVVDGRVVVGDGFGYLHILSPDDGALVGRIATDGSAVNALVPAAGGLVLQTANGTVSLVRF
jgi:outer membrane protein assembly factor BamB